MYTRSIPFFQIYLFAALLLSGCGQSALVDVPQKHSIMLRAASAIAENSIAFSSYSGAAADIIVNGGDTQSFTSQSDEAWKVDVEGVNLNQENSLYVEWYILQNSTRYIVATQSGVFMADSSVSAATFEAQFESNAFDHDNDAVSNLDEVRAGGFPVSEQAMPELVDVITPGNFTIGTPVGESGELGYENESPTQTAIANNYSIGKFEVTYSQFQTYVEAKGALNLPTDNGWGGGDLPVTNVSWSEAYAYTAWLSRISGDSYRLPTEAEWEYAARGNTTTPYITGQTISSHYANFNTPVLEAHYYKNNNSSDANATTSVFRYDGEKVWSEYRIDSVTKVETIFANFDEVKRDADGIWILDSGRDISIVISVDTGQINIGKEPANLGLLYLIADRSPSIAEFIGKRPIAVGSFSPNVFGIHDMHGNVWEWTCSELQNSYFGAEQACVAPVSADTEGYTMVKRGGSWGEIAREIRSANRGWNNGIDQRDEFSGFRVVRAP